MLIGPVDVEALVMTQARAANAAVPALPL